MRERSTNKIESLRRDAAAVAFKILRCWFTCWGQREYWVKSRFSQGSLNDCSIFSQHQLLLNTFSIFNQLNLNILPSSQFLIDKLSIHQKPLTLRPGSILRRHWSNIERSVMHFTTAGYWEDIDQPSTLRKNWKHTDVLSHKGNFKFYSPSAWGLFHILEFFHIRAILNFIVLPHMDNSKF